MPQAVPTFDQLPAAAFVKLAFVQAITGKSKPAIYAAAKEGRFPPPLKIGGSRSSGWKVGSLRRWLDDPTGYRAANDEVIS